MEVLERLIENPLWFMPLLFILAFLVQMIYYLGIYSAVLFYREKTDEPESYPPVSVIICARDEQDNLESNLPEVLEQDYPEYEVIVVNHGSGDDTDMVLQRFEQQYDHLKSTEIKRDQKFTHNKKLAVTVGIKKAEYEWLLFTDADCQPNSRQWIHSMAKNFDDKAELVLGYGGYAPGNGWVNHLIRFDTLTIALQYFAYALRGFPYMGVGRNLAYRKSLFFRNKGFAGHYHLESGDDDLFVNQTANKKNVRVQMSEGSKTLSEPHSSLPGWFRQKKRHLTTGSRYHGKTRFLLLSELISRLVFYLTFILGLVYFSSYYPFLLAIFLIRLAVQIVDYKGIMKRVDEKNLLLPLIFYDIFLPFINFMGIISNKISSNNRQWK